MFTIRKLATINNKNVACKIVKYCSNNYLRINAIDESKHLNDRVQIKGWVKALRNMKENVFLDINDGTCNKKLQILCSKEIKPNNLSYGSSIEASGILSLNPKGQLEVRADSLVIIGECPIADGYPFTPKQKHTSEYIRQYLHLRSRTSNLSSILRVRHKVTLAIHNYYDNNNYVNINTPILTATDCEGAGEVFSVQADSKELLKSMSRKGLEVEHSYFNKKTFLSVSGQLHLESMAHGLGRVYTFGPTFRAENSRSTLHLSEFYMIEAEIPFIQTIQHLMFTIEDFIKTVTRNILNICSDDVNTVYDSEKHAGWLDKPFEIITYTAALELLKENENMLKGPLVERAGISKEHELFIVKALGDVPVFIIDWPSEIKPFYMRSYDNDPSKVAALDLLVPGVGEIIGGGLREDRYECLKNKLPKSSNDLDWYLELRKFGGIPTAGYGMGLERYLQFILGVPNIKDTIPFPRWPHNCSM